MANEHRVVLSLHSGRATCGMVFLFEVFSLVLARGGAKWLRQCIVVHVRTVVIRSRGVQVVNRFECLCPAPQWEFNAGRGRQFIEESKRMRKRMFTRCCRGGCCLNWGVRGGHIREQLTDSFLIRWPRIVQPSQTSQPMQPCPFAHRFVLEGRMG